MRLNILLFVIIFQIIPLIGIVVPSSVSQPSKIDQPSITQFKHECRRGCFQTIAANEYVPLFPGPGPGFDSDDETPEVRKLFIRSVNLLEKGKVENAKEILEEILFDYPDHENSASLLRQINTDPNILLGSESFEYKMKPSDTLSLVAERFLKNKYLFYSLARYNGIKSSKNIKAGQVIRIPGKKPSTPEPEQFMNIAQNQLDKGEFLGAINTLKKGIKKLPGNKEMVHLLFDIYIKYGKYFERNGKLDKAQYYALQARDIDPKNLEAANLLKRVEAKGVKNKSQKIIKEAQRKYRAANFEGALITIKKGLKSFPNLPQIRQLAIDIYLNYSLRLIDNRQYQMALENLKQAKILGVEDSRIDELLREIKKILAGNKKIQKLLIAAQDKFDDSDFEGALNILEKEKRRNPDQPEIIQMMVKGYVNYIRDLKKIGNCERAVDVANRAKTLIGSNEEISQVLSLCDSKRQDNRVLIQQVYEKGVKYFEADEQLKALVCFKDVLNKKPSHTKAKEKFAKLKNILSNKYYRKGVSAFVREQLEPAYCNWEFVLKINPGHSVARTRRNEAKKMKCRLDDVNGKSCDPIVCLNVIPNVETLECMPSH
jgi:tetratricopeptide (TPR) repeat protein